MEQRRARAASRPTTGSAPAAGKRQEPRPTSRPSPTTSAAPCRPDAMTTADHRPDGPRRPVAPPLRPTVSPRDGGHPPPHRFRARPGTPPGRPPARRNAHARIAACTPGDCSASCPISTISPRRQETGSNRHHSTVHGQDRRREHRDHVTTRADRHSAPGRDPRPAAPARSPPSSGPAPPPANSAYRSNAACGPPYFPNRVRVAQRRLQSIRIREFLRRRAARRRAARRRPLRQHLVSRRQRIMPQAHHHDRHRPALRYQRRPQVRVCVPPRPQRRRRVVTRLDVDETGSRCDRVPPAACERSTVFAPSRVRPSPCTRAEAAPPLTPPHCREHRYLFVLCRQPRAIRMIDHVIESQHPPQAAIPPPMAVAGIEYAPRRAPGTPPAPWMRTTRAAVPVERLIDGDPPATINKPRRIRRDVSLADEV